MKNSYLIVQSHIIPKYHRSPSSDGLKSYIAQIRPMTMNWWFIVNLSLNTIKNCRLIVDSHLLPKYHCSPSIDGVKSFNAKILPMTMNWLSTGFLAPDTTNNHRLIVDSHLIPKISSFTIKWWCEFIHWANTINSH